MNKQPSPSEHAGPPDERIIASPVLAAAEGGPAVLISCPPHHRLLDHPYAGKILGTCLKCGDEKWYPAQLAEDGPLRNRNREEAGVNKQKELNEALRHYRETKRPWSGDDG